MAGTITLTTDGGTAAPLSLSIDAGALTLAGQTIDVSSDADYDPSTTRYIRAGASGSNNGTDWTNAYTSIPASLTRGYTYFVADGAYSAYTFDDADSGTSVITLKKATASSHGTSTGWDAAYGDGQAVFSGETTISGNYYVIDGQRRNASWRAGAVDEYGFKFQSTFNKSINLGGDYVTLRYSDMVGRGRDSGVGDDVIYAMSGSVGITFEYCSLRDCDRTIWITRGTPTDWLIQHCYIARNASNAVIHAEIMSSTSSADFVWRYNVIEDPEGTAVWAFLNDGTATNWEIYGNVILHTSGYAREGISGVIYVADDASQSNSLSGLRYYHNTHWGIKGLWCGIIVQAGSDNIVENNIWADCPATSGTGHSGPSFAYNTYHDTSGADGGTSSETVGTSPLTDPANGDFYLTGATTAGRTLASTYNTDPDGVTRTNWDRGAYEYV